MDSTNNSEVARIMRQITLEYEAAQRGLTGISVWHGATCVYHGKAGEHGEYAGVVEQYRRVTRGDQTGCAGFE